MIDRLLSLEAERDALKVEVARLNKALETSIAETLALIDSCWYRKGRLVAWKQGTSFGCSTADVNDPKAYEQALEAIRRNAGIDELVCNCNTCDTCLDRHREE